MRIALPCGAGGHLAAGLLAQQMGLPCRLVAGTNANDALHKLLSTGALAAGAASLPVTPTVSPSMDINVPYNMWRMLYAATGGDGRAVRRWRADFAAGRELRLPRTVSAWLGARVESHAIRDDETLRVMRGVASAADGYTIDPHTAVGVAAAARAAGGGDLVCLGCAHPVKFAPAVAAAFGLADDDASLGAALGRMPDVRTHRGVAAVAAMARTATRVRAADAAGRDPPRGCTTVFRRGEDWEARLRALIERIDPVAPTARL